jgi:hypothetical protein
LTDRISKPSATEGVPIAVLAWLAGDWQLA